MRTELIFFDSYDQSLRGTVRGLIAFISLIVFDIIWLSLSSKIVYGTIDKPLNFFTAALAYLVLCSAIAVQLPNSLNEAIVYGSLVGFVTYSVFNLTSLTIFKNWPLITGIIDTIVGTINCSIAAGLIYIFGMRFKWLFGK